MRLQGSGARSLASLQVQGVLYERRVGRDGPTPRALPLNLVEEPEAHLHPQAQFELSNLLQEITGQIVVSTHSSHLASVVDPKAIRLMKNVGEVASFKPLEEPDADTDRPLDQFFKDDMEALRRMVERPFGELLFASAVVVGDGACERALLPPLLRESLGERGSGLCVVDPQSLSNPSVAAIVKFCRIAEVEWFVFADADKAGRKAISTLKRTFGSELESRTVWVHKNEDGRDDNGKVGEVATEKLLLEFDRDLCEAACKEVGYDPSSKTELALFMKRKKGILGPLLAKALIQKYPWTGTVEKAWSWPKPIHRLIEKLDSVLPGKAVEDEAPDPK